MDNHKFPPMLQKLLEQQREIQATDVVKQYTILRRDFREVEKTNVDAEEWKKGKENIGFVRPENSPVKTTNKAHSGGQAVWYGRPIAADKTTNNEKLVDCCFKREDGPAKKCQNGLLKWSAKKKRAEPTKNRSEPAKEWAEPTKNRSEPAKKGAEPTKEQAEPAARPKRRELVVERRRSPIRSRDEQKAPFMKLSDHAMFDSGRLCLEEKLRRRVKRMNLGEPAG